MSTTERSIHTQTQNILPRGQLSHSQSNISVLFLLRTRAAGGSPFAATKSDRWSCLRYFGVSNHVDREWRGSGLIERSGDLERW